MKKAVVAGYIITLILISMFCSSCKSDNNTQLFSKNDYFTSKSFPLDLKLEGLDGTIELLQDKKLEKLKKYDMPEDGQDYYEKYKSAMLVLKTKQGKIVDSVETSEFSSLERTINLEGLNRATYFLNWHHDVGNPDQTGIGTSLYYVNNGKLLQVKAKNVSTGEVKNILLARYLRYDWKIVQNPNSEKKEIWAVYCNLYTGSKPHLRHYRYYFSGNEWLVKDRDEYKLWNFVDNAFPDDTYFK